MSPTSADPAAVAPPRIARPRHAVVWQIAVVVAVCVVVAAIGLQTASNLKVRGIASGFGYLTRSAGFEISPGPISYTSRDTYARALALALLNTLRVSLLGMAAATTLGLAIGVARLSNLWIVSAASRVCVEALRNTPLLLQILFWYSLSQALPGTRDALNPLPGVFLSQRGLFLPGLQWQAGYPWIALERPMLAAFDYRGGISISPEFAALLIALSTCTGAFIGEIVRGGIQAIDRGQIEAASALGLSRLRTLRLVVLPQALPIIVPPTTTQFLGLLKNSSLAIAIGYPDLIAITTTTLNQTGQAIESVALAAACYLLISVAISLLMARYERGMRWRVAEMRSR